MPGLVLQPIDQVAKKALAQQLACWAKTASGVTDTAVVYGTCCVSPTGETLGRWTIPPELCTEYGALPFTSQGEPIVCDPAQTQFVPYYIYADDVAPIDPNTCVAPTVELAVPTALAAGTPTDSTIPLTWASVANATGYQVQFSSNGGTSWASVNATGTAATLTGLQPTTEYTVRIRALDSTGAYLASDYSATITSTTDSALPPVATPTNLATGTATATTMPLSWDAVTGATAYHVQYKATASGTWLDFATEPTSPSTTVTGLTASTSYDFRVLAEGNGTTTSDSDYTAPVTGSTTA